MNSVKQSKMPQAKGMFVLERMREKIYVCSKNKCIVLTSAEKLLPISNSSFNVGSQVAYPDAIFF